MGTIREKSPKQGLTNAKDLTIELPEGRDFPLPNIITNNISINKVIAQEDTGNSHYY